MKTFIATVDIVVRAGSWAEAGDGVTALLTENGMHGDPDPVLRDWACVPHRTLPAGAWPKEIELPHGWLDRLEDEREVARLFREREYIEPMMVMSTAHLDAPARTLLDSGEGIVIPYEHGWIVYTRQTYTDLLGPLLDFALSQGCIWIKFDGAGSVIDGLPTFDW